MALLERRSTWLTIEGVLLIILGILALLAPFFAGLALALTLGVLLVAPTQADQKSSWHGQIYADDLSGP